MVGLSAPLVAQAAGVENPCRPSDAGDLYQRQRSQLREVKRRFIAEMTLANVPADSPKRRNHIRWPDGEADELLGVEGGYWCEYTDERHPQISHNGLAVTCGNRH